MSKSRLPAGRRLMAWELQEDICRCLEKGSESSAVRKVLDFYYLVEGSEWERVLKVLDFYRDVKAKEAALAEEVEAEVIELGGAS